MAISSDHWHRRLSPVMPVFLLGMESTTARMQRDGWDFAVEHSSSALYDTVHVIARHRESGISAWGALEHNYRLRDSRDDHGPIYLNKVTADKTFYLPVRTVLDFTRVEMRPSMQELRDVEKMTTLAVSDLFQKWVPKGEEIIVEPKTIGEMLEVIRSMQEPELKDIRERNRRRENRQEMVAAQILTFG